MKQKLWILSELFYPQESTTSFILTNIANQMAQKYEVNVICGPSKRQATDTMTLDERVNVHRINKCDYSKNKIWTRVIRLFSISLMMAWKLNRKCKKGEKVLLITNPAPLIVFIPMLKALKRFELTILAQDIFPENTIAAKIFKNRKSTCYRLLKSFFDKSYAKADKIIVCGRDMKEVVLQKTKGKVGEEKVTTICNWADFEFITPQDQDFDPQHIRIQFAGNLGRVQGIIPFIENFQRTENPALMLEFWGAGALEKKIEQCIQHNTKQNMEMKGPFSKAQQQTVLNRGDLALVTLADEMYGLGVPSKTYNYMAAGKAILYIGSAKSEIAMMVKEHQIGYCFEPCQQQELVEFLNNLSLEKKAELKEKGRRAHQTAKQLYTKEKILTKYFKFI